MVKFTLANGTEISFDIEKITRREYRAIIDGRLSSEQENCILARVAGITENQVDDMSLPEWRRFVHAFFAAAREPVNDPK